MVIGICPQFDVQWPTLTVEEHLLFYARLKGVERSQEKSAVVSFFYLVILRKFMEISTKNLYFLNELILHF